MTRRLMAWSVVLGACTAIGWQTVTGPNQTTDNGKEQNATSRPLPVEVVTLIPSKSIDSEVEYTGKIVARRASDLGFERVGELVDVLVDEGDTVTKGQQLAILDTRTLIAKQAELTAQLGAARAQLDLLIEGPRKQAISAARAKVKSLQAQHEMQVNILARREKLYKHRAVSEDDYDQARFGARTAKENVKSASEDLKQLIEGSRTEEVRAQQAVVQQIAAAVQAIEVDLQKSVLRAPFEGVIAKRTADEGTVLSPGASVVRLVENVREAHVGVPVSVAADFESGQEVSLRCNHDDFEATLRAVLPELNPVTRTQTVVLDLATNDQASAVAGDIVRLQLTQRKMIDGFIVPTSALDRGQRGLWAVMVVDDGPEGAQIASRRDVELLHSDGDSAVIRGTITAGEKVIRSGLHRMVNGQRVALVPSFDGSVATATSKP